MEYVVIVTTLALLQVFVFAVQVGQARVKTGTKAPATSGPPEFERAFRVHENTVEQLIIFIPSLWMFAYFVRPDIGAGIGMIFVVARQIYRAAYIKDPDKRGPGFSLGALATVVLLLGGLIGAVMSILANLN
jgi:glutathione S-transferase